jgi:hypothetical protein
MVAVTVATIAGKMVTVAMLGDPISTEPAGGAGETLDRVKITVSGAPVSGTIFTVAVLTPGANETLLAMAA